MTRIWVDFNDRELAGTVPAMARRASASVVLGESVLAYDDDGDTCRAVVVDSYDGFLSLAMAWGTFARSSVPAGSLVDA